ncbi:MAG: hypothetical protein GY859_14255 [Desulfobacterales bacterium]|nr:hypothetical protein [Desulfobacterales bacterium]
MNPEKGVLAPRDALVVPGGPKPGGPPPGMGQPPPIVDIAERDRDHKHLMDIKKQQEGIIHDKRDEIIKDGAPAKKPLPSFPNVPSTDMPGPPSP